MGSGSLTASDSKTSRTVSLHILNKAKFRGGDSSTRAVVCFTKANHGCETFADFRIIGWSHPIHIHLIDFQVVARAGSGRKGVTPYEAAALKDVVYLGTNGTRSLDKGFLVQS